MISRSGPDDIKFHKLEQDLSKKFTTGSCPGLGGIRRLSLLPYESMSVKFHNLTQNAKFSKKLGFGCFVFGS